MERKVKYPLVDRWVLAQFHFPTNKTNPYQLRRFKVQGTERLYKAGPYRCFLYKRKRKWFAHEIITGGCLGTGRTPSKAMDRARYNVSKASDLAQQMQRVGAVGRYQAISTEEAFERLPSGKV